ncbi:MAG: tetratricopeptide repeat protein [Anaerolineales bacterium]|nr:tetratricopeptide repeat protein [Anaerolineales bacterium]
MNPADMAGEGQAAYRARNYLSAARAFQAAAEGYRSQGYLELAAEMDNNRSVAFLQGGQPVAALQAVSGSAQVFAAQGDERREALAYGNQGAALEALGQHRQAIESYQRSAELLKKIGEHELRVPVLRALSQLQLRSGKVLPALAYMQASTAEIEHPSLWQRILKHLFETPFRLLNRG